MHALIRHEASITILIAGAAAVLGLQHSLAADWTEEAGYARN